MSSITLSQSKAEAYRDESSSPGGTPTGTGDVPIGSHTCSGCNARFTRIEHLKRHVACIHNSQDLKPHICQFCHKGFSRRDVLLRHHSSCRSAVDCVVVPRRAKRACQTCKDLKLKCTGGPRCEKCAGLGQDCVFPEPHLSNLQQERQEVSPALPTNTETHLDNVTNHTLRDSNSRPEQCRIVSSYPSSGDQKSRSKRGRYVSKACINCQKRKVKCSGEEPCLHCETGVLECIYSRSRKRRSITAVKEIPSLHMPELPSISEITTQVSQSAMERLAILEQEFRIFKEQNKKPQVFNAESYSESELIQDDQNSSLSHSTPSTTLGSSETYHGASSLFEPIRVLCTTGESNEPVAGDDPTSISWQNLNHTHRTDMRAMENETKSDIPALRHSIHSFFEYLNPHYPILNENDFVEKFETFLDSGYQLRSADDCQFVALVNLIHAIVQILQDNSLSPKIVPGWEEFCRAESIMSQVLGLGGEGNILTIQCLFLKCHYLLYLEKGDSAFDTISKVIHLAFLLRLHNQSSWIGCTEYEVHMRQRIFWAIFIQERILSVNCGVPYFLREADFKVDFPKHLNDKKVFPDQPLPEESIEQSFTSFTMCAAKWGKLAAEIWDSLFSVSAKKPASRDSEFVITMDARILYTLSQFPPHLQWERASRRLSANYDLPSHLIRQPLILHLQMNQLRLHLRQECLLTLKYDHTIAEECVSIATSSINIIHTYYNSCYHSQTNRYSSELYLVGSLLMLVCVIIKCDNDQFIRSNAIDAFKRGLAIHNELATNFTMARHALHRMQRIIGRAQKVISTFQNTDTYQLQDLGPQITEFFSSDPSWILDLDDDMIPLRFDGHNLIDSSNGMHAMESYWGEETFGNHHTPVLLQPL